MLCTAMFCSIKQKIENWSLSFFYESLATVITLLCAPDLCQLLYICAYVTKRQDCPQTLPFFLAKSWNMLVTIAVISTVALVSLDFEFS